MFDINRNFELLKEYQNITINDYNISDNYKLEKIQNSNEDTVLKYQNGKWRYISTKTTESIIDELNIKYIDEAIIILGFGIGNHIREILYRYQFNKILVLENDFELLKYSLSTQDLSDVINNKRLSIGLFKNSDDLSAIIIQYFGTSDSIRIKTANYLQYDEDIVKLFSIVIQSYANSINSIVQENIHKSEELLNNSYILKEYCNDALNMSVDDFKLLLNKVIDYSEKGIYCLNKIMEFINGNTGIELDNIINQYNNIENNFSKDSVIYKVIDLPVYRYMEVVLKDENYRKSVHDDRRNMQIKDIRRNIDVYKYRKECAEKLLLNLNNNI